jgi:putative aldouronate transport system permease protein
MKDISAGRRIKRTGFRMDSRYQLYLMLIVPLLLILIFSYAPMAFLVMAFQDYNIFGGIFNSPWVGLEIFQGIFNMPSFWEAFRNTFVLNILNLIVGFPAPLILALMLNELRFKRMKRVFQSILYLPHFLSWAIIGAISLQLLLDGTGIINIIIRNLGFPTMPFLSEKWHWLATYLGISVWQNAGWGTIIFLSALTGISPELYEAAEVDGAGRFKKIWSISLPGIKPTIVVLLILQLGRLAMIGFEQPFILGNDMVRDMSSVISVFVYQIGIQTGQYNVATAIGLFQSLIGLVLLLIANAVSRRIGERGIL